MGVVRDQRQSPAIRPFTPAKLPPNREAWTGLGTEIERAGYMLGQVEKGSSKLMNADLLIWASLRREALASLTIEGTIVSPDELLAYEVTEKLANERVTQVVNYTDALNVAIDELAIHPVGGSLLLDAHRLIMRNLPSQGAVGADKRTQNWIGSLPNQPIHDAIFAPPTPEMTPKLMRDLEEFINLEHGDIPKVVQCALAHYQFETIHPFGDGNGRVGRLLIILQLIQLGMLTKPLVYASYY